VQGISLKFRRASPPGEGISGTQNHRMVGVGRDLCGSPNPLPKQGHLQQAVEDLVQAGVSFSHAAHALV